MLFNSYIFILLFLPITIIGFFLIGERGYHRVAMSWLVMASLLFYGYWHLAYLALILISIVFNYGIGIMLSTGQGFSRRWLLFAGVAINIGALGYYKYANFFVDNINRFWGVGYHLDTIVLPLAISFFTFQQVAFLVDAYRGEVRELNFLRYSLFVTFFPQLIAGPIVHHKEMLPQFAHKETYQPKTFNLMLGITIFTIGLFKKVVIADGIAEFSSPVFGAAEATNASLLFLEAWGGALGYTFQLYFDFSGYSDMAIGLALMFGVQLPINFDSPYRACSIIDFWRRWHMTLSRFLRDYLYIPLGGSRCSEPKRLVNLLVTMLLGGLWHGAGWTFVLWGGLHGIYLVINHLWRKLMEPLVESVPMVIRKFGRYFSLVLTFLAVVIGWVFFRAESLDGALAILRAMSGENGIVLPELWGRVLALMSIPESWFSTARGDGPVFGRFDSVHGYYFIVVCLLWVWFVPNVRELFFSTKGKDCFPVVLASTEKRWWQWRPNILWGVVAAVAFFSSLLHMTRVSEFLYFQF